MDLRMVGLDHEKFYCKAQEKNDVQFVRGGFPKHPKIWMKALNKKRKIRCRATSIKMNVDLLVLLVGMEPRAGTKQIGTLCRLDF